ncbi:MAG: DUF6603 domain-containing protein [Cyanobacteria bacterium J06650_10]
MSLFAAVVKAIERVFNSTENDLPPLPVVIGTLGDLADDLGLSTPAKELYETLTGPQLSEAAQITWRRLQTTVAQLDANLADADDANLADADIDELLPIWLKQAEKLKEEIAQFAHEIWTDVGDQQSALDQLIGIVLQTNYPRIAGVLMMLEVLTAERTKEGTTLYTFDRERLDKLINQRPASGSNNDLLLEELKIAYGIDDGILATMAALLVFAPRTIAALNSGALTVDALPELVPDLSDPDWIEGTGAIATEFRKKTRDWVSLTFPIKTTADASGGLMAPRNALNFVPGIDPEQSITLAFRSYSYQKNSSDNIHLEAWLDAGWEGDRAEFRFHDGSEPVDWPWEVPVAEWPWVVSIDPSISFGLVYDPQDPNVPNGWDLFWAPRTAAAKAPLPKRLRIALSLDQGITRPDLTIGPSFDTHIRIGNIEPFLEVRKTLPVVTIGIDLQDFQIVISPRFWRVLGQADTLLRDGIRLRLDGRLAYAFGQGVQINALAGLSSTLVFDKKWGGSAFDFMLHSVTLQVDLKYAKSSSTPFNWRVSVRAHISAKLGPIVIVLNGVGIGFGDSDESKYEAERVFDQLGINDPDPQEQKDKYTVFPLLPTGLGIALHCGPVRGGGYVDWRGGPTKKYAGALSLSVTSGEGSDMTAFAVTALGIKEDTPSGELSFIAVLGVRFTPGIFVGPGLFLTGIGGLFGHERRADMDAMRFRLSTGSVGRILSLRDPIRQAPAIIDDLEAFFPVAEGVTVVGLSLRLSWAAGLINFDLALIFEIARDAGVYGRTGLTKIIILGSAAARGPHIVDRYCYDLQMDMVGFIDFVGKQLEIHAVLVRSNLLLELFQVTGDVLILSRWGNARRAFSIFSLGGFHPGWSAPVALPSMARVGVMTSTGSSGVSAWFRLAAYLAITTNTLQFGSRIELGIQSGPFQAYGFVAFDTLIYFDPFWFDVKIQAGVGVRFNAVELFSVSLLGQLIGPNPMTLRATACVRIIVEICLDEVITFIEKVEEVKQHLIDLDAALLQELQKSANLIVQGVKDSLAVLRGEEDINVRVFTPAGELAFQQSLVPLSLQVSRSHGQRIQQETRRYDLIAANKAANAQVQPLYGAFAPGSFTELDKSEALNRPAFEELQSGIRVVLPPLRPPTRQVKATVETITLTEIVQNSSSPVIDWIVDPPAIVLSQLQGHTAAAASFKRSDPQWQLQRESWTVETQSGGVQSGLSMSDALARERSDRLRNIRSIAKPAAEDLIEIGGI